MRSLVFAAILMTTGCGGSSGEAPVAQSSQSSKPKVAASMEIIPVSTDVTVSSLTSITDNFNTQDGLITASWGIPPSMGSDPSGAFRMICGAGQVAYDDPIVYPGQPGKAHLHQFYGNLAAGANSTYTSLRTTGNSTCGDPSNPAAVNRSGYWMPAMLDGAGNVVKPEYVAIYYKRLPASDPRCTRSNPGAEGDCVGIPTGLRFITGYNMATGTQDAHPFFYCQNSDNGTIKAVSSTLHDNISQVIADCPVGARLTLNISAPDCWDGKNLDTADHRSHVAFGSYVWDAAKAQSYYRCDDAHPYVMPQLAIIAFYTVDANFAANKWHLSSDEMVPGALPGTTFHADYWEAWSPTVRDTWLASCINGHLNCAGGDLGNGTAIKGMTVPSTQSQLIALSTITGATTATATGGTTATTGGTTTTTTGGTTTTTTGGTTASTGGTTTSTGGTTATCKGRAKKCSA
jgi:hypothetical protein